jgi:tRNA pseudouridine38-40 synthase
MRIALRMAYLGTNYHGFQVQPDVRTVEGELLNAFIGRGIFDDRYEANYSASGRTDKGVHASAQVVSFNTEKPDLTAPRIINSVLPEDIWTWARAEVKDDFDPRRDALSRTYTYFLYENEDGIDVEMMRHPSSVLIGEHDFSNLSSEKNVIRKIKGIEIVKHEEFVVFNIKAESFAWKMVRKIVTALKMIGMGVKDENWLINLLDPEKNESIPPVPAYGLLLTDVMYDGIDFVEDGYAKERAMSILRKEYLLYGTMGEVLKCMEDTLR